MASLDLVEGRLWSKIAVQYVWQHSCGSVAAGLSHVDVKASTTVGVALWIFQCDYMFSLRKAPTLAFLNTSEVSTSEDNPAKGVACKHVALRVPECSFTAVSGRSQSLFCLTQPSALSWEGLPPGMRGLGFRGIFQCLQATGGGSIEPRPSVETLADMFSRSLELAAQSHLSSTHTSTAVWRLRTVKKQTELGLYKRRLCRPLATSLLGSSRSSSQRFFSKRDLATDMRNPTARPKP